MTASGEPFDPYYHWLGIPPEEQPPNHYRLLGVQLFEDNREVIQNAADRQMAHLRTFQAGPRATNSQRMLNELSAARVCLLSAEKKASYDEQLRQSTPDAATRSPASSPPVPPTANGDPAVGVDDQQSATASAPLLRTQPTGRTANGKRLAHRSSSRTFLLLGGLLLLSSIGGAIVVAVVMMQQGAGQSSSHERLVLHWPAAQRQGATLEIDGQPVDIASAATVSATTLELPLAAGPHSYRIARPQAHPLSGDFVIEPGSRVDLDVVFTPIANSKAQPTTRQIVLVWSATDREQKELHIDGKPYDLTEDNVEVTGDEIRITLPRGRHTVAVVQDDTTLVERTVDARQNRPVHLANTGTLQLRWSVANRKTFSLAINGQAVDFDNPDVRFDIRDGNTVLFTLPAGSQRLEFKRDNTTSLTRPISIQPGRRLVLDGNRLVASTATRISFSWPVDKREGATLEVDGTAHPVPTGTDDTSTEFTIDVAPGTHTIRITHPHCELFEREVTIRAGLTRLSVQLQPIASAMLSEDQLRTVRDEYVKTYTQFAEFRTWSEETDAVKKRRALRNLLNMMSLEAGREERASPEQFVAYDQTYRMALEQDNLVTAADIVGRMRTYHCITVDDENQRTQELWKRAVESADLNDAVAYFRTNSSQDRTINATEQQILERRITKAPELQSDYGALERLLNSLASTNLLSDQAANRVRSQVLLRSVENAELQPIQLIDYADKMLKLVPLLLAQETEETLVRANALVDAANTCRRKVLADRRSTPNLRPRVEELKTTTKMMQEAVTQSRRVADARQAVADGQATTSQHKLLGLWLLQQAKFNEALPHLQQSGDSSLAAIAQPLPETARDLSERADAIETESKRTKYLNRHELALLAFANHVRQLALARKDGTLNSDSRSQVEQRAASGAEQTTWETLQKGKWNKLLDVLSLDALKQNAESATEGTWTVAADGSFKTQGNSVARLALPIKPLGNYALRLVCRSEDGEAISIHLPMADHAVVFVMGTAVGQLSGLQLIQGRTVADPDNMSAMDRTVFRMRRQLPVLVELHVEQMPLDSQSAKQRKLTGGKDWVRISGTLNGKPIRGISAAAASFSVAPPYQLPDGSLGFAPDGATSFSNVELLRK